MLKISLVNKTEEKPLISRLKIKDILREALKRLEVGEDYVIEVLFVSKDEIKNLNFKHRNINKETDVLSFPQKIFELPVKLLGSIVICQEVARERNESIEDLVKHGTLHLLGYDHETNEEKWNDAANKINCRY